MRRRSFLAAVPGVALVERAIPAPFIPAGAQLYLHAGYLPAGVWGIISKRMLTEQDIVNAARSMHLESMLRRLP